MKASMKPSSSQEASTRQTAADGLLEIVFLASYANRRERSLQRQTAWGIFMQSHRRPAGLEDYGISGLAAAHWNLPAEALYEEAVRRGEGQIAHGGALAVQTGL